MSYLTVGKYASCSNTDINHFRLTGMRSSRGVFISVMNTIQVMIGQEARALCEVAQTSITSTSQDIVATALCDVREQRSLMFNGPSNRAVSQMNILVADVKDGRATLSMDLDHYDRVLAAHGHDDFDGAHDRHKGIEIDGKDSFSTAGLEHDHSRTADETASSKTKLSKEGAGYALPLNLEDGGKGISSRGTASLSNSNSRQDSNDITVPHHGQGGETAIQSLNQGGSKVGTPVKKVSKRKRDHELHGEAATTEGSEKKQKVHKQDGERDHQRVS